MDAPIWIVVGLGNPGARYSRTRHNIGFRVLDRLRGELGAEVETDAGGYRISWATVKGERVALVRPMTFMNRSSAALARMPEALEVPPERHLVVLDDVSIPFGSIRFRSQGTDGGHNGLSSILRHLRSVYVPRLRLGVGCEERDPEQDLADFVLEPFSAEEERAIPNWLERAAIGVRVFLEDGPDEAMNRFNG